MFKKVDKVTKNDALNYLINASYNTRSLNFTYFKESKTFYFSADLKKLETFSIRLDQKFRFKFLGSDWRNIEDIRKQIWRITGSQPCCPTMSKKIVLDVSESQFQTLCSMYEGSAGMLYRLLNPSDTKKMLELAAENEIMRKALVNIVKYDSDIEKCDGCPVLTSNGCTGTDQECGANIAELTLKRLEK